VLSICYLRCTDPALLQPPTTHIAPALLAFFQKLLARVHTSKTPPTPDEADAFYMASALLRLIRPHTHDPAAARAADATMACVLKMLHKLLETDHLLSVSMALNLLTTCAHGGLLQGSLVTSGVIEKVRLSILSQHTSSPFFSLTRFEHMLYLIALLT
jgi:hypothetical protein